LRQRFDLRDLVDDLEEFLDQQKLECPPILGLSFGGVLALELAARRPHRLQALLTQGVGPRFEPGLLRQVAGFVLSRYHLPDDNPFVNQFFNLFFGGKQAPGPLFEFVTRQCWQTDQGIMAHRFALVENVELAALLEQVRVPALVMAGARDLLVSGSGLEEMQRRLPRGRVVRISKAGHLAFVTHPQRVASEVKSFLNEIA
jgi:pimeloyl-ACP methyl ester carboxylesterase